MNDKLQLWQAVRQTRERVPPFLIGGRREIAGTDNHHVSCKCLADSIRRWNPAGLQMRQIDVAVDGSQTTVSSPVSACNSLVGNHQR